MTEIPENPQEHNKASLEAHDGGRRPDKEDRNPNSGLYTESGGCDSTSDLDDVAEDYLRKNIDEVGAVLAKRKRDVRVSAQRNDAALIKYIVAYLAAHSDPQPFLRDLQVAISKSGSSPRKLEPADA